MPTSVLRCLGCGAAVLIVLAARPSSAEEQTRSVRILEGPSTGGSTTESSKDAAAKPAGSSSPLKIPQNAPAVPAPTGPTLAPRPQLPGSVPTSGAFANDLSSVNVRNPADLSIDMLPGQAVTVGSRVSFRVTSKQAGYLLILDIDASGKVTQIYPNMVSLLRTSLSNGNYIRPGKPVLIPLPTDPYAGVEYVVSPPSGSAMIVAMLSSRPVQIVDLPDVPQDLLGQSGTLAFLAKRISEVRIQETESGQLGESKWSLDARPYTIQ
jgi:Domain of unknown function (DUF4384)